MTEYDYMEFCDKEVEDCPVCEGECGFNVEDRSSESGAADVTWTPCHECKGRGFIAVEEEDTSDEITMEETHDIVLTFDTPYPLYEV